MMTQMRRAALAAALVLSGTDCSLVNSENLPPEVSDPAIAQTPAGARAAYLGVLAQFRAAYGGFLPGSGIQASFVLQTGLLTDELGVRGQDEVDRRALPEGVNSNGVDNLYPALQKTRAQAAQAITLLGRYLPEEPALAGHLYALKGYSELFLAEFYCSGIPLSTMDYAGDFTYRPGSSTEVVFQQAVALFDTALTLAGDSAAFMDLARVGRARALLALGQHAEAAAAAAAVADGYRYEVLYNNVSSGTGAAQNFARFTTGSTIWDFTVSDREGLNGLDWRTSGDPRTPIRVLTYTDGNLTKMNYSFDAYATDGSTPLVLASGVEARLIQAEGELQAGSGAWLTILNALRTDGTYDTQPNAQDPSQTDTLWHAGSGGVAGLRPLSDPGTAVGRVDLLFRERGFWLFLTGHRQGDLRRLIRQYGRSEGNVYPVGTYLETALPYGSDVTAPIPTSEYVNPLYTGCASRGA